MDNPCTKSMSAHGLCVSYEIKGKKHSKYHSEWLKLYKRGGCATKPGSSKGFQVGKLGDHDRSHQSSEVYDDDCFRNINKLYKNGSSPVLFSKTIYARYKAALKRAKAFSASTDPKNRGHRVTHPRISAGASSNINPNSYTCPGIVIPPYKTAVPVESQSSFNPVAKNPSSATTQGEMFQLSCGCFELRPVAKPIDASNNNLGLASIKVCKEPEPQPKTEPQSDAVTQLAAGPISESSNLSYCTCTPPTPATEPKSGAPTTSQKIKSAIHCHLCKRPIIVVPAGEGVPLPHFKHGLKPKSKEIARQTPFQSKTILKSDQRIDNVKIKPEKTPSNIQFSLTNLYTENLQDLPSCSCPQVHTGTQVDHQTPHSELALMSEISKQLCELNKKLDILQRTEIFDIRHQMDTLSANVQSLNQKFQDKEMKTESSEYVCCAAEQKKTPKNMQPSSSKNAMEVKDRSSSDCEFCKNKNLPVLNSFHKQLVALIGNLKFSEVLMSILLRRDNVYHVRVQDMIHDKVLGCFLVSDAGIEEAIKLGVFEQTMTFSVVDVRNTLKPRKGALGIAFEFSKEERQIGGCDTEGDIKLEPPTECVGETDT